MADDSHVLPDDISGEVRDLLQDYFHRSNASSSHNDHEQDEEHFADLFTENGVYEVGGQRAHGRTGIIALREELFRRIPHRDHQALKIFTRGANDQELMALGRVEYVYASGQRSSQIWATHYVLARERGILKFRSITVILNNQQVNGHS